MAIHESRVKEVLIPENVVLTGDYNQDVVKLRNTIASLQLLLKVYKEDIKQKMPYDSQSLGVLMTTIIGNPDWNNVTEVSGLLTEMYNQINSLKDRVAALETP